MSTFERIVVPVDGSEPSERAVALAIRLASDLQAALTFCHVVDREAIVAQYIAVPYGDAGPSLELAHQEGERFLEMAAGKASQAGVEARTKLLEGPAVEEIVRFSRAERFDLIVMGSHGRRGLARIFMGSVAEGVLRTAPLPVLVVRCDDASTQTAGT
ncbi:MAG: universal stress protein [Candidatus Baltobacteraceae bacterium]|jgi:nucleotide-binding universal stress UspA family protein